MKPFSKGLLLIQSLESIKLRPVFYNLMDLANSGRDFFSSLQKLMNRFLWVFFVVVVKMLRKVHLGLACMYVCVCFFLDIPKALLCPLLNYPI